MIEWHTSQKPVDYNTALDLMEQRVAAIHSSIQPEMVWMLEHNHVYTAGVSANNEDLLSPGAIPVINTGRGGKYTYHGPGQRVVYVMLDLKQRAKPAQPDLKKYVSDLEQWLIDSLAEFSIIGERRKDRIGIWVVHKGQELKIAAIGIRVRKWITYHGVALNICPNMEYFRAIIPCGIKEHGVTSMAALGQNPGMALIDQVLREKFINIFGQ